MQSSSDLNPGFLRQNFTNWSFHHFAELPSTNQYLMHNTATLTMPAVVVAEVQTAGRGRGMNRWWSPDGALTFSLFVTPAIHGILRTDYSLLSLMIASLVRESIIDVAGIEENRLLMKWPNDLYLDQQKVCGILLEQPGTPVDSLIVGIGLNVNNSFQKAPQDLTNKAISLIDVTGTAINRTDLLTSILTGFEKLLSSSQRRKSLFPAAWESAHLLHHRLITLEQAGNQLTGRCEGIDETGALIFRDMYGLHRIHSAVILDWSD